MHAIEVIQFVSAYVSQKSFDFLLIEGDFNLTLEPIDLTRKFYRNSADKLLFERLLHDNCMIDTYLSLQCAIVHPSTSVYSYIRSNCAYRIDQIFLFSVRVKGIMCFVRIYFTFESAGARIYYNYSKIEASSKVHCTKISDTSPHCRYLAWTSRWVAAKCFGLTR